MFKGLWAETYKTWQLQWGIGLIGTAIVGTALLPYIHVIWYVDLPNL